MTPEGVELATTSGVFSISALAPGTFKVRVAKSKQARALPSFAVEAAAPAASQAKVEESESLILMRTPQALLRIDKEPLRIRLLDPSGGVVADDLLRAQFGDVTSLDFGLAEGEHVFGLGDKVRGFDRRGNRFELWNLDSFGWKVDSDPLYKSIPFLFMLRGGRAHGLFIDNPARAHVDVGSARADTLSYATTGPSDAFDVYLFAGGEPKQVLEAYTALTGRMPLPPQWALGHHQSRYGYLTEAEVRGVVKRMQKESIPLDAIWLDIDFQQGNAPFTVNRSAFPGFTKMLADFTASGVHTVVITDPHIKSYQNLPPADYAPYVSGAAGDHFLRDAKGAFVEGKVWPGASVFPEFTLQRTRSWWGGLYRDFVAQGVSGFWNDMNEPALLGDEKTFPEALEHRLEDGSRASHRSIHNAYGALNVRATYEGVLALRLAERPFVLTRAAYAGVQRYAASWTGDNTADRAHLAVTIPQLLNLGVSGFAFNGADVGGFIGCPDADLFAEWMELGALQPFFRNHSMNDACRREPWLFGAATLSRARKAVERRYRLLPYLYTVFEESSRTGAPVMRPLWFEYPTDESVYDEARAYLLGRDLLVAPKLVAGAGNYEVKLPRGEWYDTVTLERVSGGTRQVVSQPADSVRLFARAGAIVPQQPVVASTRDAPRGPLLVEVWPGDDCSGSLYVDDGSSFDYRQGKSLRIQYGCERTTTSFQVSAHAQGSYAPWWKQVRLLLHDVSRAPRSLTDGAGQPLQADFDAAKRTLAITLADAGSDFRVNASF